MKLTSVIISVILASSTFGYGLASAQQVGPGGSTPCTASYPCAKICGDHPCAPGEVYTPGGQITNTTKAGTTKSSGTPSMQTQLNVSANATVSKTGNGTAMQTMTKPANGTTSYGNQTMSSVNSTVNSMKGTIPSIQSVPTIRSPVKQVSSGIAPADVKCSSGYQLVLNKFDSRPACVTADVMAKLIARGWAASS